ncbi:putative ferric-chelate reductase 1 homolog [Ornithodoros turicata]|uniref:putative ferric-chelate reductase 1 homolog n=1 Tax=Ornithodoros turicata TaxID=34597 RepID=UPI003138740F
MASSMLAVILVALSLAVRTSTYGGGAPNSSCENMRPHHHTAGTGTPAEPQQSPPPQTLEAELQGDGTVKVTLSSKEPFRGFQIQARRTESMEEIVPGTFVPKTDPSYGFLHCDLHEGVAVTHRNNSPKTQVVVYWTPPKDITGSVTFMATAVQDMQTFWLGIKSDAILFTAPVHQTGSTDASTLVETSTVPGSPHAETLEGMYSRCGDTTGCLGNTPSCIASKSCKLLVTWTANDTGVNYEMTGKVDSSTAWVAAGISPTKSMHDAAVVECFMDGDKPEMRESWNAPGYQNKVLDKVTHGLSFLARRFANGVLSCAFYRDHRTVTEELTFDTSVNSYHVLLASGPFDTDKVKRQHTSRRVSEESLNLNLNYVSTAKEQKDLFVQLHGSLMIAAWLFFVSTSILIARYYKKVWEKTVICGVKPWFAIHRLFMILALMLMIAGMVLIFYRIGGWSATSNPHPILGIVSAGLAVLQPFMAAFRCGADAPNRYIFNWLHWMNGNSAFIIAVITIFFAPSLNKAQLEEAEWFVYVVVAFVIFNAVVHIIMQLHQWGMDRKVASNDIKMSDRSNGSVPPAEDMPGSPKDAPGGGFRRFVLGVYVVVALLAVAVLVATIWLA